MIQFITKVITEKKEFIRGLNSREIGSIMAGNADGIQGNFSLKLELRAPISNCKQEVK